MAWINLIFKTSLAENKSIAGMYWFIISAAILRQFYLISNKKLYVT